MLINEEQLNKDAEIINKAVKKVFKENNLNVQTDNLDIDIKNDKLSVKVKKEEKNTLEELKQEKETLQKEISKKLIEFEAKYKVKINDLDITRDSFIFCYTKGMDGVRRDEINVSIDIRL